MIYVIHLSQVIIKTGGNLHSTSGLRLIQRHKFRNLLSERLSSYKRYAARGRKVFVNATYMQSPALFSHLNTNLMYKMTELKMVDFLHSAPRKAKPGLTANRQVFNF